LSEAPAGTGSLFARLRDACARPWHDYTRHDFVLQLGAGTLPDACFRRYLVQDYLFLIHAAGADGLAAYKAETLTDVRAAAAGLSAIVDQEIGLHVAYCGSWGMTEAEMAAAEEAEATMAYTRYVLEAGAAGDLLDLHVALAPCVIGYAEIGRNLAPNGVDALGDHPYREWITEYAGDAYQGVAANARRHLDDLAARAMTERRFDELAGSFGKASRLEADFWQMGLDAAR